MSEPANKGAILLQEKLKPRGAKAALAKALAIGPDLVSRWLSGDRTPDTKHRARLEDEYGINWRLWDEQVARRPRRGSASNKRSRAA
jgi:transcriptional regulator with XRE-family HTH domain